MEEQQRTPEKPSSAPSTDSSPDTLRPSSGTTTPRVLVDNVAKWKLPQHLLIKVLTLLPPSDPLTIHTLLNARQVSKRFEIMANVPSTWDSQLALWSKSAAPQWIQLPPTCDKEDQEEIDRIFPERKCPSLRGRDEYRARWLLDRLAGDHLIHLVDSETDKIKSFELLCAVGKQAWDRVLLDPFRLTRTEAEEDDDEGEDDLAALYWSMEVRRSIERRAAAAIWRAIDSGELGRDDWERREWGIAAFAGFAGGNIMQVGSQLHLPGGKLLPDLLHRPTRRLTTSFASSTPLSAQSCPTLGDIVANSLSRSMRMSPKLNFSRLQTPSSPSSDSTSGPFSSILPHLSSPKRNAWTA